MLLLTTAKTVTIIQVNLKDNLLLQCEWNEVIKIKPKMQIFFTNIYLQSIMQSTTIFLWKEMSHLVSARGTGSAWHD